MYVFNKKKSFLCQNNFRIKFVISYNCLKIIKLEKIWRETHTNKNMNATSNMISPHCVIQTLLTLLKNWCLSPPLYLLLQSRGRFLTVLFISFFTHWSIFWKSHSENTSHFQEFQSKEIDTFFNNKSQWKWFFWVTLLGI